MLLVLLGSLGGWSGCAVTRPQIPSNEPLVHLFLLAGQSNMAGRGIMTPARTEPIPGVMALQADGSWGAAVDPLHWDKTSAGVGLARSFARAYQRDNPGVVVGFIPAACGGSPIEVWEPGMYFEATKGHPYDDAMARTRQAVELSGGKLMGVLWHQGESDSQPARADLYRGRLEALVARFRRDLGDAELPMLMGQLGRFEGREWTVSRQKIDEIQREIVAGDSRLGFVSAEGLESNPDLVHFDAASLDEFGGRYAREWARLVVRR
jgi:hypothetical protein